MLALIGRRTDALAPLRGGAGGIARSSESSRGAARLSPKDRLPEWDFGDREAATAFFEEGSRLLGSDGFSVERAQLLQEIRPARLPGRGQ